MAQIKRGETVPTVRNKLSIQGSEYNNAWSELNKVARDISFKHYGTVSAKKIGIVADYFRLEDPTPLNDEKIGHKLVKILKVDGAAAWLIVVAQKRVQYYKIGKAASGLLIYKDEKSAAGSSTVAGNRVPKTFDPIKDI